MRTIDVVLPFVAHLTSISLTWSLFAYGVIHDRGWHNDYTLLAAALCKMLLMFEALHTMTRSSALDVENSIATYAVSFIVIWTSKASTVLLSAKMLNVTSIHGVRAWIVGTVFVLAGVSYGIAIACNCGQHTGSKGADIYRCFPPSLLWVSSLASEMVVDLNLACILYNLLLEGFTMSTTSMSVHKKTSMAVVSSVIASMALNVTLTVQTIVHESGDGLPLMRLVNYAPAASVIFASLPNIIGIMGNMTKYRENRRSCSIRAAV